MTNLRSDDEIDLIQVIMVLWEGKWLIFASLILSLLVGLIFTQFRELRYSTTISYSVKIPAPEYDIERVERDYEENFFSPQIFGLWKDNNPSSLLSFDMISNLEEVNGVV